MFPYKQITEGFSFSWEDNSIYKEHRQQDKN